MIERFDHFIIILVRYYEGTHFDLELAIALVHKEAMNLALAKTHLSKMANKYPQSLQVKYNLAMVMKERAMQLVGKAEAVQVAMVFYFKNNIHFIAIFPDLFL